MIFRESITLIVVSILAIVGAIGYASSFFMGDDNVIEEKCEQLIQSQTGVDIDLTQSSPETQKSADDLVEEALIKEIK